MSKITSSIDQFVYQPGSVQPGTVYHYIKSNIDGSYPARIFIYMKDQDHLEVLKFEAHGMDAALVSAHMDWETFSADRLESWWLTPDGKHTPQASLSSSYPTRTFTMTRKDQQDTISVGHYPVHVYNFDLISLNFSLPHWTQPEGEVTIGILQPNFDPNPTSMLNYEGTITIRYSGEEMRNEQACRKYTIGGDGLKGCVGTMWVNKAGRMIEDIEIPVADNPDWDTFKFNFISSRRMDLQEWAEFMESEISSLKTK